MNGCIQHLEAFTKIAPNHVVDHFGEGSRLVSETESTIVVILFMATIKMQKKQKSITLTL